MQSVLGIDVSKGSLDVILVIEDRQWHKVFANEPDGYATLQSWLVKQTADPIHVCLEATGQYGDGVANYLYEQGHRVSVVNPARIKRYGDSKLHRNKTDKADAALIAEFCQKEKPAFWKPMSEQQRHLRALERRLAVLQASKQQERNRQDSGEKDPWVLADLQAHLDYLEERIRTLRTAIQTYINENPALKSQQDLLVSIPGIGKITAASLLAELGDLSAFENAPQLAAFAGLNPLGFRSGSSVRKKTRISKQGRAFLRHILYMPAVVAKNHNPVVMALCTRLADRKLSNMAIIVAAMHKLLNIVFGVLKHQMPFDPHFGDQFNFAS